MKNFRKVLVGMLCLGCAFEVESGGKNRDWVRVTYNSNDDMCAVANALQYAPCNIRLIAEEYRAVTRAIGSNRMWSVTVYSEGNNSIDAILQQASALENDKSEKSLTGFLHCVINRIDQTNADGKSAADEVQKAIDFLSEPLLFLPGIVQQNVVRQKTEDDAASKQAEAKMQSMHNAELEALKRALAHEQERVATLEAEKKAQNDKVVSQGAVLEQISKAMQCLSVSTSVKSEAPAPAAV